MVVPVQDPNDPLDYEYATYSDSSSCCACSDGDNSPSPSNKSAESTTTNYTSDGSGSKTSSETPPQRYNVQYQKITKDLVGNSKEFRIENNKCDLRIIGNSNRIRIGCNHGNLQIIGNSTRLKIANNNGNIRYTGNDGRICLGSDSAQQAVDYIGSNGILKVVSGSMDDVKCTKAPKTQGAPEKKKKSSAAATKSAATKIAAPNGASSTAAEAHCAPKKVKVRAASYGGTQWQQFNELFQRNDWTSRITNRSLPNLKQKSECSKDGCHMESDAKQSQSKKSEKSTKNAHKHCKINNNINIVNTYGSISIKNSVNVKL